MKPWFYTLAIGVVSTVGVNTREAQAGGGFRTYLSYVRYPISVVHPAVREAVKYAYSVAPAILTYPTLSAPTVTIPAKTLTVPQGGIIRLKANLLGSDPGHVFLAAGSITLECRIQEWNPQFVTFQLPNAGILSDTSAEIVIATKDGSVKRRAEILIVPIADIEIISDDGFALRVPKEILGER